MRLNHGFAAREGVFQVKDRHRALSRTLLIILLVEEKNNFALSLFST